MARSRWKLKYFSNSIWRKINLIKKNKKLRRRYFYDRSSTIPDCFFLNYIRVHKGKRICKILIENGYIGKKFGEFSFTRKPFHYPPKKQKKKNNLIRR